jgi:hypothetical protein
MLLRVIALPWTMAFGRRCRHIFDHAKSGCRRQPARPMSERAQAEHMRQHTALSLRLQCMDTIYGRYNLLYTLYNICGYRKLRRCM